MGENYKEVRRSSKGVKGESHRGKFVGDRGNEDKRDKIVSGDGRRNKILTLYLKDIEYCFNAN